MLLFRVLRHKNCAAAFTFTKNETDHRAIQTNRQTGNQRYSKAIADQKRKMYCALCSMRYALCSVQYALCIVQCVVCTMQCAWCIVHCAVCMVHCAMCNVYCAMLYCGASSIPGGGLAQFQLHPRQLQSTPTFGVCMRRMIIMEN